MSWQTGIDGSWCPRCGGGGQVWIRHETEEHKSVRVTCGRCHGHGTRTPMRRKSKPEEAR